MEEAVLVHNLGLVMNRFCIEGSEDGIFGN